MKTAAHHAFEQFYIDAGSRAPAFADGQYEKEIWRDQFTWFMRGMQHQAMTDDSKATAGEPTACQHMQCERPDAPCREACTPVAPTVPLPEALTDEAIIEIANCHGLNRCEQAQREALFPFARSIAALSASAPPQPVPLREATGPEVYIARVAMLRAHAQKAKKVTEDDILDIASMDADELRRRAIVARDWHRLFASCLDGLGLNMKPGAAPEGCWFPDQIRNVVKSLIEPQPVQAHVGGGWQSIPPDIVSIIDRLHTQDNRITESPLFAVQQKNRIYGLDSGYQDGEVWVNDDGTEFAEKPEEDARKLGYRDEWEFVTGCLTEQGCKNFMAINGHNLKEPRIYAYGSYRNEEWKALRKWLMGLPAAPGAAEQPAPEVSTASHVMRDGKLVNVWDAAPQAPDLHRRAAEMLRYFIAATDHHPDTQANAESIAKELHSLAAPQAPEVGVEPVGEVKEKPQGEMGNLTWPRVVWTSGLFRMPAAGTKLYTAEQLSSLRESHEMLREKLEAFDNTLSNWARAYPLTVFPEPDLGKVAEVLKAAGLTIDSVSASNMRHVVTKLNEEFEPVRSAMAAKGDGNG